MFFEFTYIMLWRHWFQFRSVILTFIFASGLFYFDSFAAVEVIRCENLHYNNQHEKYQDLIKHIDPKLTLGLGIRRQV